MKRLALAVIVALLAACNSGPDLAACEQAMRDQFEAAIATGEQGIRPAECDDVPSADLERIANEIISDAFSGETP